MNRLFILLLFLILSTSVSAQMVRERVVADRPVDNTFFSTKLAVMQTVETIAARELAMSIMHTFSEVSDGVDGFWGLDNFANIRIGFDYGINDDLSVGIGRSRVDKIVDMRFKYVAIRQTTSGSKPVSIAVTGNTGINVSKNPGPDVTFSDRTSLVASVAVARKFSNRSSVQVSPTFIRYNLAFPGENNNQFALGMAARYRISTTTALGIELAPVLAGKSDFAKTHASMVYDIETGGHVFQLFFTTSQGLNEQYAFARNQNAIFSDGEPAFRFGFNVNRIFKTGKSP